MHKNLRKKFVVAIAVLLSFHTMVLPIGQVVAQTIEDTQETAEQSNLSEMDRCLPKDETVPPRFSFAYSHLEGTVGESTNVKILSDQEVSELCIKLPKEAKLLKNQLPAGLSIQPGNQPQEWQISADSPQQSFILPILFEDIGTYELLMEDIKLSIAINPNIRIVESGKDNAVSEDNSEANQDEGKTLETDETINREESRDAILDIKSNDFNTVVTPNNFQEYFGLSGSASISENIITLTEARNTQSGSIYLKNKIDSTFPFVLKGKVFLGTNINSADGIGFGFHRDSPDKIGLLGSGFGLAGLTDIFGFKLDTYYNGTNSAPFRPDPINTGAFGSFVYMDNGWFTSYMGADAPARSISRPAGLWQEVTVSLAENSILIVEYEGLIWEKELPRGLINEDLSFLVSASTGGVNALQQFQFDSFSYSRNSSIVTVNYIDDEGVELHESKIVSGLLGDEYQTYPEIISGYTLKEIPNNASGIFKEEEQIVNYVYIKEEPVLPVDPLDPEVEVDPENKPDLPEDQGPLSIDFASTFNFGSQVISAQEKTYYAKPQRLLNEDGTVNEDEERPNYIQISDRRPENDRNGWQLAVTQNGQFETADEEPLLGARLSFTNQALATAQGGILPELQQTNPLTLVPDVKRVLVMAQGEEGTGTWIYRFGNQETAGESIGLTVPQGANPQAAHYRTTLTWELSAVPGNE